MKEKIFLVVCLIMFDTFSYSQDIYSLKSSKIHFYAGTPIEDIEANNTKATSIINLKTGDVLISIPNNQFKFKNALMEEHFNENYLESDKFPKSTFKGKIIEIEKYDFTQSTPSKIKLYGALTIHGITKSRTIEAVIRREGKNLTGESKFIISLADHNIQRPQILWEKLSENVEITLYFLYEEYLKK